MEIDLKTDLNAGGCAVCNHMEDAAFAYFSQLQYGLSHEGQMRETFAEEGGLCRFHTWQLAAFSSRRGLAKGLAPLLSRLADELIRITENGFQEGSDRMVKEKGDADCRVCGMLYREEAAYVSRLSAFMNREEDVSLYGASRGICLRHLGLLVKSVPRETAGVLLRDAARRFREMGMHLNSYDDKLESGNRSVCSPAEKHAGRHALIQIAGAKYLSFPMK